MSDNYQLTADDSLLLEAVFTYNPRPSMSTLQQLAEKLAVGEHKVYNWFINKRLLVKKETTQSRSLQCKQFATNLDLPVLMIKHVHRDDEL